MSGLFVKLRGRAAQAQRYASSYEFVTYNLSPCERRWRCTQSTENNRRIQILKEPRWSLSRS